MLYPLFLGGHFDAAVATAFIQVEVVVRDACGYPDDLVGVKLMRRAFHPETGPLTDPEAVEGERQAVMDLFAGAIGYHKNPFSHRIVGLSQAAQAASLILVANELLATVNIHKILKEKRRAPKS